MTEDGFTAWSEGRATVTDTAEGALKILREQLVEDGPFGADTESGRNQRYAFVVGAMLANVPEPVKTELLDLIRFGMVRWERPDFPRDPAEANYVLANSDAAWVTERHLIAAHQLLRGSVDV